MADEYLPPVEFLRECFSYNPETGVILWRTRPESHFASPAAAQSWNSRSAGTRAFVAVDPDGYERSELRYEGRRLRLKAHRAAFKILTGEEPDFVDHINCNTLDNRGVNLRAADAKTNSRNRPGNKKHSLPKGVHFAKGRFCAKLGIDGKKLHLGIFDTPAEAHAAYCAYAASRHGEFFNPGPAKPSVFD